MKQTSYSNADTSPVTSALYAFGDDRAPLPETVRILDEIVTDYIIDTVQIAAKAATVSGRAKVKADDIKFALRNDEVAIGRMRELITGDKFIKDIRKTGGDEFEEGKVKHERGPGRGRKKRKDGLETHEVEEESKVSKKTKIEQIGEDDLDLDDLKNINELE